MAQGKKTQMEPPSTNFELVLLERAKTYRYAILLGISIGAVFCATGFVLALLGLTGTIQFLIEAGGMKARLVNASPGALFATLGMIVIWRYKPRMHDDLSTSHHPPSQPGPTKQRAVFRALERDPSHTTYKSSSGSRLTPPGEN